MRGDKTDKAYDASEADNSGGEQDCYQANACPQSFGVDTKTFYSFIITA